MSGPHDRHDDYIEFKKYDDLPFNVPDDVDDDDVLMEQDNDYVRDRWDDAEDYEWM